MYIYVCVCVCVCVCILVYEGKWNILGLVHEGTDLELWNLDFVPLKHT